MRISIKIYFTFYLIFFGYPISAQNLIDKYKSIEFEHLSIEDGISSGNIVCILQDSRGFIWFGTEDGLNKFDAYKFTIYRNDFEDPKSISNSVISSIAEDHKNTIWVGTNNGLNAYNRDTDDFYQYFADEANKNSISDNYIQTVFQDSKNRLWIGTWYGGLNLYNYESNDFKNFRHNPDDPHSIASNHIKHFFEDSKGDFWIGTNGGLNLFDVEKGIFKVYKHEKKDSTSISSNSIRYINEDSFGNLWICTYDGGLNYFDRSNERFMHFQNDPSDPLSISHNQTNTVFEIEKGILMISTNSGLNISQVNGFPAVNQQFINIEHHPGEDRGLNSNITTDIYKDKSGRILVGTRFGGVNIYSPLKKLFKHYKYEGGQNIGLNNNNVTSYTENSEGNIWIGTDGGGLNHFNKQTNKFNYYTHNPNQNSISSDKVISVMADEKNNLWIGMWDGGVDYFDIKQQIFTHFKKNPDDSTSISSNDIFKVYQDSKDEIWIGTWDGGLNKFIKETNSFKRYPYGRNDKYSLLGSIINDIIEDKNGMLWIGTSEGGLSVFDPKNETFLNFRTDTTDLNSLSYKLINSIYEDQKGYIWICTNGDGLKLFNPTTKKVTHFRVNEGLSNNMTYGLLEEGNGNFWISTNYGLSRLSYNYASENYSFKNFNESDGLQSNQFNKWSYLKDKSGGMYFGGINGFNFFHPDSIIRNQEIPEVVITNFLLNNKEVSIGEKMSPLNKQINEAREILLERTQNSFSFEFAALNYLKTEKNQYAYMMVGFDKEWIYAGKKRETTYTNLDAGTYTFKVKASNNDGVWNEDGTSIKITILPYWWETIWLKIVFIIIGPSLFYLFYRWKTTNLVVKKNKLQSMIDEQNKEILTQNEEITSQNEALLTQNDKLEELNASVLLKEKEISDINHSLEKKVEQRTKELNETIEELNKTVSELDRFVYSASHDISAPLKSILGIINLTKYDHMDVEVKEKIQYIEKSINQLERVIKNLTEFSRNSRMEIKLSKISIKKLIEECFEELKYLNQSNKIELVQDIDADMVLNSDRLRLKIIINNLLSNAIKYQDQNKSQYHITTSLQNSGDHWQLMIKDNGIGIANEYKDRIFEMFYRATEKSDGSGLGLFIVSETLKKLNGSIRLDSKIEVGTTFYVELPKNN